MINTHNLTVTFGKHKGELWTRLPVSYLRWLANETQGANKETALAELERRGTVLDRSLELSSHPIDRASLRCRKVWHETALNDEEGIYSWLLRVATEALSQFEEQARKGEKVKYGGLKLVYTFGDYYPILKTVLPGKKHHASNNFNFNHPSRSPSGSDLRDRSLQTEPDREEKEKE